VSGSCNIETDNPNSDPLMRLPPKSNSEEQFAALKHLSTAAHDPTAAP